MTEDDRPFVHSGVGSALLGDAASRLAYEDLDPYSHDELTARIALLEAEIARVRRHDAGVQAHRAAADALFGKAPVGKKG